MIAQHAAGPNLLARATILVDQYAAYEEVGEQLVSKLREYAENYRQAGLVERWDNVANDWMDINWEPGHTCADGFSFRFIDLDGDSGSLFLPFAYLQDPAGYIADLVQNRREKEEETERLRLAEEAAARPARIAKLRAELAELTSTREPQWTGNVPGPMSEDADGFRSRGFFQRPST